MRSRSIPVYLLAVVGTGLLGWLGISTYCFPTNTRVLADSPVAGAADKPSDKATGSEAGIKAITAAYAKAFNAGDAKAASELWTEKGEYVGADGEVASGRAQIEKSLAAYFEAHPKATVTIRLASVRIMGRGLATAEGVVALKLPGEASVIESRYTALHVLEDGKWYAASVREWVPDPATEVTPKQLEWLIGEWGSKGTGGELKIAYAWDADKVFLLGKYTLTKDGKTISKGTQVFGRNPTGGLRSWMFDSSGTTSDGLWVRDENRWVNEATGMLPDGTEVTSVNVLIPLGPDSFTWQTTERAVDGISVAALPPVKVTRVKK